MRAKFSIGLLLLIFGGLSLSIFQNCTLYESKGRTYLDEGSQGGGGTRPSPTPVETIYSSACDDQGGAGLHDKESMLAIYNQPPVEHEIVTNHDQYDGGFPAPFQLNDDCDTKVRYGPTFESKGLNVPKCSINIGNTEEVQTYFDEEDPCPSRTGVKLPCAKRENAGKSRKYLFYAEDHPTVADHVEYKVVGAIDSTNAPNTDKRGVICRFLYGSTEWQVPEETIRARGIELVDMYLNYVDANELDRAGNP